MTERERLLQENAKYANELLNNPLFLRIFNDINNELMEVWSNTGCAHIKEREACFYSVKMLHKIKQKFEGYIAEAKYEKKLKETEL